MSSFTPNRALINPKFDGYKLAPLSQEEAVSHYPLQFKPSQTNVSGRSHVSFQEVQSRILHNHLVVCSQDGRAVYIDQELRVVSVIVDAEMHPPSFNLLYELPKPIEAPAADLPQREYPSAAFLDSSTLFVCDGYGSLYVLHVSSESADLLGQFEISVPPAHGSSKTSVPFRIHQAVQATPQAVTAILSSKYYPTDQTASVDLSQSRPKGSTAEFDIWGVEFVLPMLPLQAQPVPLDITWRCRGEDVPLHSAFDDVRKTFLLVGSSTYRAINVSPPATYEPSADELAPIPRAGENLNGGQIDSQLLKPPPYSWTQTPDSVTVAIPLPSSTPTKNITVTFLPRTLTVLVRSDASTPSSLPVPLPHYTLQPLWDQIKPTSLWTFDRAAEHAYGLLTLHLDKAHADTRWAALFAPGAPGTDVPETLDPSELYAIREALEKYTAALQDGSAGPVPSLADGEMDDEVDTGVGRTVCLSWVRADGAALRWPCTDAPVQLLSTPFPGGGATPRPSLVVKHGLDGLVYALDAAAGEDDPPTWTHTSTFSVLSFVLASKRDTRFTHHVSSKAVFAFESGSQDLGGNVYIYRCAPVREKWARQAVLKVGGGAAGSLLGVGAVQTGTGKTVMLCLCEGELIVLHDVL